MKAKETEGKHIIRLEKGEEIIRSINSYLTQKRIDSGYFFGIGAISTVELAHYNLDKKQYSNKTIKKPLEVLNMTGNIAMKDKERIIHTHITVSDKKMKCYGGHLKSAVVAATIEIILTPIKSKIGRKYSEEIGLNLLDLKDV